MSFLNNLTWRYATKKFDGRKVADDVLEKILEAIRLSPSSFGIQPYHIIVVANDEFKQKLNPHAFWDQEQIATCSHLLIFCADADLAKRAKDFVALARQAGRDDIANDPDYDYEKGAAEFGEKTGGVDWATTQTYIALGFTLAACAELEVDSCPMEGADFTLIRQTLNLPTNLEPKVLLPIGYRSLDDEHIKDKKLRFDKGDLFDFIN